MEIGWAAWSTTASTQPTASALPVAPSASAPKTRGASEVVICIAPHHTEPPVHPVRVERRRRVGCAAPP